MKTTHFKLLLLVGAGALENTAHLSAQATAPMVASDPAASPSPPSAEPAYGLLGSDYLSLDYGYIRFEQHPRPIMRHDYGLTYNRPLAPGLDLNVNYDYLTGTYQTIPVWHNEATVGLTAFVPAGATVKPFLNAAGGWDWQHSADRFFIRGPAGVVGGTSDPQFTYLVGAGAEFQLLRQLVVTPFADYHEIRHVRRDVNFGLKATYRINPQLGVSLIPQIDYHRNLDYAAAVNYHF